MTRLDYFTVGSTLLVLMALITVIVTVYLSAHSQERHARIIDLLARGTVPGAFFLWLFCLCLDEQWVPNAHRKIFAKGPHRTYSYWVRIAPIIRRSRSKTHAGLIQRKSETHRLRTIGGFSYSITSSIYLREIVT
ncbi:MAG: hypothetical protein ABI618_14435 [Nitrospirota bacterium]